MNLQQFKDVSAGIQSVVVALAVLIGGVWTLYTFQSLRSADEARAKVATSMSISISSRQVKGSQSKQFGLAFEVLLENTGGQDITVDLTRPPLTLTAVSSNSEGKPVPKRSYNASPMYAPGTADFRSVPVQGVQVKSKKTISFYVEVDQPGTYFAAFSVPESKGSNWSATKLVEVVGP